MTDVQSLIPGVSTQLDVEHLMYSGGIRRAQEYLTRAETSGRSPDMPYAKDVFRDYVQPLADAIQEELDSPAAGIRTGYAQALRGLDIEAVAFLSVRYVFATQLSNNPENHRQIAYGIGRTVHQELLLFQVESTNPELYHTLVRDMGRRLSRDARHRINLMRHSAKKDGIEFTEWPIGVREQVGMFILGLLERMEFVCLGEEKRKGFKRVAREVILHPEIMERIDRIRGYISLSMPVYGPCIEPPKEWATPSDGGYHSPELRRANPLLVRGGASIRDITRNAHMPIVLRAVNALQNTAWAVNSRMLNTIYEISKNFSTKEIVSLHDQPKPPPPVWLTRGVGKEDMTPEQYSMFFEWKKATARWHTARKLQGTAYGRFYSATRQAEMFKEFPRIFFVYFADSRGRLYPLTYGMNPQGSDLGKALLHFAEGKPLDTPEAVRWFHVQGANKWGFDKATLTDRHAWVVDRQDEFLAYARDPIANRGWTVAGDPLQFLAWCFEYRDYVEDTSDSFVSRLPISMDGSCNG